MALLSACLIVKNESLLLSRCLESLRSFADEIIVVDTGSTDDTIEIAQRHGAQVKYFAWIDDFSAARNESLRHAGGDWILYIDADEVIDSVNAGKIRRIIKQKDIMGVTVRQCIPQQAENIVTAFYIEYCRLFRRHPAIRFEGAIHEQILPSIERIGGKVLRTDIVIHHWAYAATEEKKRHRAERNLRYLLAEVKRVPDDSFVHFNLGMTYRELGQQDMAICSFHRALDKDDGRIKRELIGQIHLNLAKLYLESGNSAKTEYHARQISTFEPDNPLSYYILATVEVTNNQFNTAIKYLESAIKIAKRKEELSSSADLNMSRIYLELGCCRSAAGDYEGAEAEFIRSIECNASVALPHLLLGNCRFMRGDLAGARDMYERTLVLDPLREDAQRGLDLCCGRG
jgi:glycosyltransferase involved in cell wall biosynthesis